MTKQQQARAALRAAQKQLAKVRGPRKQAEIRKKIRALEVEAQR
jgi:hypothetical protein